MKFSTQEEYGLRCLIQVAKYQGTTGIPIPEIAANESLTTHNVAKLLRILRLAGFLTATRGHGGGYLLAKDPDQIKVAEVLSALGGRLYDDEFCRKHKGENVICTHSTECTMRSLWTSIQQAIDRVLDNLTLSDLLSSDEISLGDKLTAIQ